VPRYPPCDSRLTIPVDHPQLVFRIFAGFSGFAATVGAIQRIAPDRARAWRLPGLPVLGPAFCATTAAYRRSTPPAEAPDRRSP